jgi:hypothetical protein
MPLEGVMWKDFLVRVLMLDEMNLSNVVGGPLAHLKVAI